MTMLDVRPEKIISFVPPEVALQALFAANLSTYVAAEDLNLDHPTYLKCLPTSEETLTRIAEYTRVHTSIQAFGVTLQLLRSIGEACKPDENGLLPEIPSLVKALKEVGSLLHAAINRESPRGDIYPQNNTNIQINAFDAALQSLPPRFRDTLVAMQDSSRAASILSLEPVEESV